MVRVREAEPLLADGSFDQTTWLKRISVNRRPQEVQLLYQSCQLANRVGSQSLTPLGGSCLQLGLMMAEILDALGLDAFTLSAAIIYESSRYAGLTEASIGQELGEEVLKLVQGVNRIQSIEVNKSTGVAKKNITTDSSLYNLRSMLLAVVEDVRIVLLRLAEHTCEMRFSIRAAEEIRKRLALETREIYAPLTNRLGIGQLKWELEDLAFRCLDPVAYKGIAKLLDERRVDRELYIEYVVKEIESALNAQNVVATVYGRAKNIFSIWKKMQRKRVSYAEIYDIRAIRVLVPEIKDCYAALGIIHTKWKHIPKEFDDYIANPKENGYRSLHTAVVGPDGKTLEIQIRTHAMHEESELGVAAHWRYKEGISENRKYQRKLMHLRQLLRWQQELTNDMEAVSVLHEEVAEDRVYVFTQRGEVINLIRGATPLDFAYQLDTDVGHRCRGAKVNGRIVPLTEILRTGQQVELLTTDVAMPNRDWLNPQLGYLKTAHARAKVHIWFKQQDWEKNVIEGRAILEQETKRLGIEQYNQQDIATKLNFTKTEDLLAAIGSGDIRITQILNVIQSISPPLKENIISQPYSERPGWLPAKDVILVEGTGNAVYYLAHCCQPTPDEEIVGYIEMGSPVMIHRADCKNILQLTESQRSQLIQVSWDRHIKNKYLADIIVKAYDRQGLIHDITHVLSGEYVNVVNFNASYNQEEMAEFKITVQISGIEALGKVLLQIQQLPNITEAYRYRQQL